MLLTFNQKYGSLWTVKPKKLLKLQASQFNHHGKYLDFNENEIL